jgi:transposase InsO family protein
MSARRMHLMGYLIAHGGSLIARTVLASWQRDYNEVRPHSAHGGLTPTSLAAAR